jgi:SAM-dependent methyltransferase
MTTHADLGLASLGRHLRDAGLTARSLAAWAGTARIAALPARLAVMPTRPPTPAGAILALFVAGAELEADQLRTRPAPRTAGLVDALIAHDLVERDGDRLRARVAILPLGPALLVCDRLDAAIERDLVCWPDDSSHHLATAIPPGRRAAWLDLGCGSAFAPLARPELATRIAGIDLNARAVRYAQLGAGLSGIAHLAASAGDAGAAHDPADLVTCNAPMPADPRPLATAIPELWRSAEPGFFERLWPALRQAVRPDGMIVVHAACAATLPALAGAAGERVIVAYTPVGTGGFAVAWWRPDAPDRFVAAHRALTPDRPHLEPRDRDDALAR